MNRNFLDVMWLGQLYLRLLSNENHSATYTTFPLTTHFSPSHCEFNLVQSINEYFSAKYFSFVHCIMVAHYIKPPALVGNRKYRRGKWTPNNPLFSVPNSCASTIRLVYLPLPRRLHSLLHSEHFIIDMAKAISNLCTFHVIFFLFCAFTFSNIHALL